jgi:hypothetical protein
MSGKGRVQTSLHLPPTAASSALLPLAFLFGVDFLCNRSESLKRAQTDQYSAPPRMSTIVGLSKTFQNHTGFKRVFLAEQIGVFCGRANEEGFKAPPNNHLAVQS